MRYIASLLIYISPLIVIAQNSTLKTCGERLYEKQRTIYANDLSRKQGLKTLSNRSNAAIQKARNDWSDCVEGKIIPGLDFVTIDGKKYRSADFRGKVLVINFWFKGCAPCVSEMPALNKLVQEFKNKDVVFIGFATDKEKELKPMYHNSGKFLFQIVPDSQNIAEKFVFDGYPTTYIVDQNGKIAKAWTGLGIGTKNPYEIAKPIISRLLSTPQFK